MARRIEHRSTSEWPAVRLYEALIDIDYLNDRLEELGGANAELVQHVATDDGARFQIRHSVPADSLPSVARTVVGGDLTIDRSESWRREEDGHYTGEIAAEIAKAPCTITGSMWLRDVAESANSEFVVSGNVRVNVPFVGGKLEDLVADQVQKLLSAEERFTAEWLARRA
ncbi:DUF2505 domain-containing protein [Saccharopolyspora hirsuta]|uniref:DUF2505 domain-containing protein n=1 Tax=Saccharopolyspora hirsuta TaxID=1837 RepID=A0A5M7BV31_SACHI|nr:DUF2505 domain-containing protein [Saccharopolyspora hirsuta]KAA5833293.1 DUF2505 domain-containing protein [Saccharopolyspora hirsuta]MBF6508049.1 DUF2505 domain-containing protein [Nocardia farcinica]